MKKILSVFALTFVQAISVKEKVGGIGGTAVTSGTSIITTVGNTLLPQMQSQLSSLSSSMSG
jgi:hypothetical protein